MNKAAFNTGSDFHLLDHIAPLAALYQMPLFTTEELNTTLARKYYPQVEVHHLPDLEFRLGEIAQQFDTLYECKYWMPHLKSLFHQLHNKEMKLIFCPHGQSDKGFQAPLLAPYSSQDAVLIYGDLMLEMLKQLQITPQSYTLIGNYRLQFYQKHRPFYESIAQQEIFSHLNPKNRTLLYAPTWRDADHATSFFDHAHTAISQLPSDWNLIIKCHPLLEQRDPAHFYSITAQIEQKPNAILVHDFPPVYPILARSDVYLGDASSVGYDFLFFERPMFFFPTSPSRIHTCGTLIDPTRPIYPQLNTKTSFAEEQRKLYRHAFTQIVTAK